MKGSLVIVAFFILGTLTGGVQTYSLRFCPEQTELLCSGSTYVFFVGFSIGNDSKTLKSFRSLNPPSGDVTGNYYPGHSNRQRINKSYAATSYSNRLFSCWGGRIRLLFVIKYLHNRV